MNTPPILSIPMEIIQRIMVLSNTGPPQPVPQQAPFVLSHVNRAFRDISLDTPELWQSTTVDSTSTRSINPAIVGLFLSRAGSRPRDIAFTSENPEEGGKLLEEIMSCCQHWRDVQLRLPLESFSRLIAYRGPFPMLRSLSLSPTALGGTVDGIRTIIIRDAPSLREVTVLLTISHSGSRCRLGPVDDAKYDHAQRNLLDLKLALEDPSRPLTPPFTLPSLQSLLNVGKSILPFLTVPSLACLEIRGPGFSRDIQELTNEAAPMVVDLQLWLRFPSGLKESATVLQEDNILPRLQTLRIILDAEVETFDPLLDTLRSRRQVIQGRATLEAFYLSGSSIPPPAVRTRLLAFENEDMHISMD
ncbi:hypothetical protein C8R44DRAFT_749461 [Mycena epipterygia]|nr:hypothetical protein C8R44DRAFT_749461 [Mycena epipterygia]